MKDLPHCGAHRAFTPQTSGLAFPQLTYYNCAAFLDFQMLLDQMDQILWNAAVVTLKKVCSLCYSHISPFLKLCAFFVGLNYLHAAHADKKQTKNILLNFCLSASVAGLISLSKGSTTDRLGKSEAYCWSFHGVCWQQEKYRNTTAWSFKYWLNFHSSMLLC